MRHYISTMAQQLFFLVLVLGYVCAAPGKKAVEAGQVTAPKKDKDDLNAASSSYISQYSSWGGGYPGSNSGYSGYGVTGYGTLDDKYSSGYYTGYDNTYNGGYPGYSVYNNIGYGGYNKGYGSGGYGLSGGYGGYGGYGGNGGNGGINSYTGYSDPYYQGGYHLGYGYYNRRPHGNIYSNGITPNLVTGYRGYSRR